MLVPFSVLTGKYIEKLFFLVNPFVIFVLSLSLSSPSQLVSSAR